VVLRSRGWLVVLVLRALGLVMLADLSGLTHTAFDLACVLTGGEHVDGDCEDGEPDHECPPGCIDCHCWHAGLTTTAPPVITFALAPASLPPALAPVPPAPYNRTQPKAPDHSTLYRPPRALATT
jgi:hypothetical protein